MKRKGFYAKASATIPSCFRHLREGCIMYWLHYKADIFIFCYLFARTCLLVNQILVYTIENIQIDYLK